MHLRWVLAPFIFIIIVALYGLYITTLTYYLYNYLKFKKLAFISKRYPLISCIQVISTIICIAINFTVITLYRCIEENTTLHQLLWTITIFSQPLTLYACLYSLVWRSWHFYFDGTLNKRLTDASWHSIITNCDVNDWYAKHKSTYGKVEYVAKRIFILYFISCAISTSIWYMHHGHDIGYFISLCIEIVTASVPFVLFLFLYYKAPKDDVNALKITREMRRISIIVLCSLVAYLVLIIIAVITADYQHIFAIITVFVTASFLFCISMTHTQYVMSYVRVWMKSSIETLSKSSFNLRNRSHSSPSSLSSSHDYQFFKEHTKFTFMLDKIKQYNDALRTFSKSQLKPEQDSNVLHKRNVREICENKKTFSQFAKYLGAEYSIECLLALIEMMQFQHYVEKNIKKQTRTNSMLVLNIDVNDEAENEPFMIIEFNDFVPRSHIVYRDSDQCNVITIKQKAYYLYMKYIASGASYEVNIDFKMRNRFRTKMHDYDVWMNDVEIEVHQLLSMFNNVSIQMYQLLSFSLSRFKSVLKERQWNKSRQQNQNMIQIDFANVKP